MIGPISPDLILLSDLIAEATPIEERRTGATSASCREAGARTKGISARPVAAHPACRS
jgi:hypothetical protein